MSCMETSFTESVGLGFRGRATPCPQSFIMRGGSQPAGLANPTQGRANWGLGMKDRAEHLVRNEKAHSKVRRWETLTGGGRGTPEKA